MRPMPVLEFYGLPGAGKSTIAEALGRHLHAAGLRVGTRELISEWIAAMPRREKLGFRLAATLRLLTQPRLLWTFCTCVRPLQLRRYVLLFMKAEALVRLRRRGVYDLLVLDQWLLQDLWSLFVPAHRFPADLPAKLWAATADAPLLCHVTAPVGEVAVRLSTRHHGQSRFDGLDPGASRARLSEVEGKTRQLLDSVVGEGERIGVDSLQEVQGNALRLAEYLLPEGTRPGAQRQIKRLVMITPNYPSLGELERGAFVERLVGQWQEAGLEVSVIAPLPRFSLSRWPVARQEGGAVAVAGKPLAYPPYLSLSARRIGPLNLKHWSWRFFANAAERVQEQWPVPDAFYGKFLFTGAAAAVRLGQRYGRPVFADLGESTLLAGLTKSERALASRILGACAGVVCVSPRLMDDALALGVPQARLLLSPNVADPRRFHIMDRASCRRELGLPEDDFIVAFVGHFIERKGPLRVLEAINLAGGRVKGVFLGRGAQLPSGERVLHAAPVPNEDLPRWLNAADALVLPTLAEGCCNAIAEAMACGLPVISSDIADVRWQVPPGAGRLVDPNDVVAISQAIRDCEAQAISTGAPRRASVAGGERAEAILAWMQVRVQQWNSGHR